MISKLAIVKPVTIINFKTDFSDETDLKGQLKIEERDSSYFYYCWNVFNKENIAVASKCLPVSKRAIPTEANQLDFVINHAIESINRYRIGRQKVFKVTYWTVEQ